MVDFRAVAEMIVRCPVCQSEIVHNGITRSHATYDECLEALATDLFLLVKRMIAVVRLVLKKRKEVTT